MFDVIVIGAGQAGLAAGYYLQRAGLNFVILEGSDTPVGSWPHFYDSLVLNSPARYSSLPGLPFPGDPDHYPLRDDVVAYLAAYATHFRLPIRTRAHVSRVERAGDGFQVMCDGGVSAEARAVVAATGFFGHPVMPKLPGQELYRGETMHVAAYCTPEQLRGKRVVVVGGGNAAVQIGVELATVAKVTLATRRAIRYLPQRVLGRDVHFWLRVTGLDQRQWLGERTAPVYAAEAYRSAIAAGRPDRQPMFARFVEDGVEWSDGRREVVDMVVFATGYRSTMPYLAGLGALCEHGTPLQRDGLSTTVAGLGYVGLPGQRSTASATLRGVGPDAAVVVGALRRSRQLGMVRPGRNLVYRPGVHRGFSATNTQTKVGLGGRGC
jgi:putative flavoprotein involved in K+ transport